jgi:hypothetical protein
LLDSPLNDVKEDQFGPLFSVFFRSHGVNIMNKLDFNFSYTHFFKKKSKTQPKLKLILKFKKKFKLWMCDNICSMELSKSTCTNSGCNASNPQNKIFNMVKQDRNIFKRGLFIHVKQKSLYLDLMCSNLKSYKSSTSWIWKPLVREKTIATLKVWLFLCTTYQGILIVKSQP